MKRLFLKDNKIEMTSGGGGGVFVFFYTFFPLLFFYVLLVAVSIKGDNIKGNREKTETQADLCLLICVPYSY